MQRTYSSTGKFLSTPSARRATFNSFMRERNTRISIHALCEEGDPGSSPPNRRDNQFLSTPSARRATQAILKKEIYLTDFYPRPLRGGRQHGNVDVLLAD